MMSIVIVNSAQGINHRAMNEEDELGEADLVAIDDAGDLVFIYILDNAAVLEIENEETDRSDNWNDCSE